MNSKTHDLAEFLQVATNEMAAEYTRIQKRATEDPGTAGDQGEENWAELFRNWLPPTHQVVTKGRILSFNGIASPQVDVLVLQPTYPKHLVTKKLYLAGGVAAAFECKLTLKSDHIKKAVKNAAAIRRNLLARTGTPYKELNSPILYGLLAHSHVWNKPKSKPIEQITKYLIDADREIAQHPSEMLDMICVADLATWQTSKVPWFGPQNVPDWNTGPANWFVPIGAPYTTFMCHAKKRIEQAVTFSPIGAAIAFILRKLAWEDTSIRELAKYFFMVNLAGSGVGTTRTWPLDIYSDFIRHRIALEAAPISPINENWNEWAVDM